MYGWEDFDQAVAAELAQGRQRGVNDDRGMLCPFRHHPRSCWLPWQDRRRHGTVSHGNPSVRFHASPTFVYDDQSDNLIVGVDLVRDLVRLGKAESRIEHEASEDAVSWNVFRSLEEAGRLRSAVEFLTGIQPHREPELYLWGVRINHPGAPERWPHLRRVLCELEPRAGQQTEPDVCLFVPDWGWIVIEAKLGSPTTLCRDDAHLSAWKDHYLPNCEGVFDARAIRSASRSELPEQLLRNVLVADRLRRPDERAMLVNLTRQRHTDPIPVVTRLLVDPTAVQLRHVTWEQLYFGLCAGEESLGRLRDYFEQKSLNLRPAFDVPHSPDPDQVSGRLPASTSPDSYANTTA